MDLQVLKENREQILDGFAKKMNADDVRHIRYEIDWMLSKADCNDWSCAEDAYTERISGKPYSDCTKENKKRYLRHIFKRIYPDMVPECPSYCHLDDPGEMLRISKGYRELSPAYRSILDRYVRLAGEAGKKRDTIFTHANLTAGLFRHFQGKGCALPGDVTEDVVLSFFYGDPLYERQIRSYSYKEKLAVVLRTCAGPDETGTGCMHVLNLLPSFGYARKNIEYLTDGEAEAIRGCIDSARLSPRNRAIMMLLLYTGMRSCDIASLRLCDIDWKSGSISIIQQKTSEPLVVAMLPAVGNAIFDYLESVGHAPSCGYLFPDGNHPGKHVRAVTVRNVANRVYRLAGVRQGDGDRKGTHLFRHRAATQMLGNGVQRAVISRILGHTEPDSLETYLHADFRHLRGFALSLEAFPIPEGVWET